ncbi:hypothetical protein NDU88_007010 [Pleurodeles waltl]|uniref:Uncharacterized protein n=1 Tax=Pleurodeles waltl TaxID=8319 RepID=A0AAV7NRW3_PLEWA|nr:hypothetical protein NDU88_007010 [Pleurodeles waltl]
MDFVAVVSDFISDDFKVIDEKKWEESDQEDSVLQVNARIDDQKGDGGVFMPLGGGRERVEECVELGNEGSGFGYDSVDVESCGAVDDGGNVYFMCKHSIVQVPFKELAAELECCGD